MSNVLRKEKKQEVIALGRLGWPLRRIEEATGVRRETASGYLKEAGITVRPPGWQSRESTKAATAGGSDSASKPAIGVILDPEAKPAMGVTPDFVQVFAENPPTLLPPAAPVSLSQCEPFRETIEEA